MDSIANNHPPGFFARLKQHHIYRVAAWYGASIAVLIQIVARAFPYFGWSGAVPAVIIILIAGFPVAVVLAWLLVKPADSVDPTTWQRRHWKLGAMIMPAVIAAVTVSGIFAFRLSERNGSQLTAQQNTANSVAPASTTDIRAKSIAVLPFANESENKNERYFSDGLSEALITALSQFAGLKVISRNSAFQFRDSKDDAKTIGEKLGVVHLLEGTVQHVSDEVRITATLVNAADGSIVWSQSYDRPYRDLFALQDAITQAVADALKTKLLTQAGAVLQSDRPPSGNLAAYNAFLRGQFYLQRGTEADTRQAIARFTEAIRLDPNYALAYALQSGAWLSMAATFLSDAGDINRAYAQARVASDTALRLNPDLAAAHAASRSMMIIDFNWSGALAEAQRTAELAPASPVAKFALASIEARLGQVQAAVELQRLALESTPLDGLGYFDFGRMLNGLGRLDESEAALRKAIILAPGSSRPYTYLAMIKIQQGDAAGAMALAKQEPAGFWHDFAVALTLQVGADRAAADAALKDLIAKYTAGASYQIAEVYALRREPDNAFKWLEKARINRDSGVGLLLFDPFILRYKDDPRFAAHCKKVGLPTATDGVAMKL